MKKSNLFFLYIILIFLILTGCGNDFDFTAETIQSAYTPRTTYNYSLSANSEIYISGQFLPLDDQSSNILNEYCHILDINPEDYNVVILDSDVTASGYKDNNIANSHISVSQNLNSSISVINNNIDLPSETHIDLITDYQSNTAKVSYDNGETWSDNKPISSSLNSIPFDKLLLDFISRRYDSQTHLEYTKTYKYNNQYVLSYQFIPNSDYLNSLSDEDRATANTILSYIYDDLSVESIMNYIDEYNTVETSPIPIFVSLIYTQTKEKKYIIDSLTITIPSSVHNICLTDSQFQYLLSSIDKDIFTSMHCELNLFLNPSLTLNMHWY